MNHFLSRASTLLLLLAFGSCSSISHTQPFTDSPGGRERLAILPFELVDLSKEEGLELTAKFAAAIEESRRFEVLRGSIVHDDALRALADAGKALGAAKVVHVRIVHRDELYVLFIRLVGVDKASLLYAERVDFSGEFNSLLSQIIPEQARKLTSAHLDAATPWIPAVLLGLTSLGVILWIYARFRRTSRTVR